MYPRNAPKIVSFPATPSNTMPFVGSSASPITNQAPVYPSRVDGRTRTIYVTSNVDISEWDTHSINAIYALADGPEFENEQEDLAKQPIRSTHSSFYTQATIPESAVDRSEESRVVSSARVNASSAPERLIAMAPAITSTQSSSLCDYCNKKPKFSNYRFCSTTCGRQAATLCNNCHKRPKYENFDYCGKTCAALANPGGRRQTLVTVQSKGTTISELPSTDATFRSVADQFKVSWRHKSACPRVRHVYKIDGPPASLAAYNAYREKVESQGNFVAAGLSKGNERRRWHGTRRACTIGDRGYTRFCSFKECSLCSIIHKSYDISLHEASTDWGRLGKGIYTSSTSSKSNDYSFNDSKSSLKAILLNNVVVGKGCKLLQDDTTLTAPPAGYDSVLVGGSLNHDELVVYSNDAIRPSFLVMYENAEE